MLRSDWNTRFGYFDTHGIEGNGDWTTSLRLLGLAGVIDDGLMVLMLSDIFRPLSPIEFYLI